jgi:hypothetical protein
MRTQFKFLLVAFMICFTSGYLQSQIEKPIDPIPPQEFTAAGNTEVNKNKNPLDVHFAGAPVLKYNLSDLKVGQSVHISQLNIALGKETYLTAEYNTISALPSSWVGADTCKSDTLSSQDSTATLSLDGVPWKWGNIDMYDTIAIGSVSDSVAAYGINKGGWVTRIGLKDMYTGSIVAHMCPGAGLKRSYQIPEGYYPHKIFFNRINVGPTPWVRGSKWYLRYRFFNE